MADDTITLYADHRVVLRQFDNGAVELDIAYYGNPLKFQRRRYASFDEARSLVEVLLGKDVLPDG